VPNALLIFRSNSPNRLEDYHKEMDSHNFELWFKNTLLPNLKPNSVIVMDNAPYHSRKLVTCPSRGRRAEVLQLLQDNGFAQFMKDRNLPFKPNEMTMSEIFALCKQHRAQFDKYAVDEAAREKGHMVLRLPPYHCMFNAIEMLWSYQKNLVRQGSTWRTVEEAKKACQENFVKVLVGGLGPHFDHV